MSPTPNRHHHKFTLPKWETQHNLTCTNISVINTAGASTSADRRSSRDDDDEGVADVREKLMHEATRMKGPNLRKETDDDAETLKSWFVRRSRQKREMKAPITTSPVRNGVVANGDDVVSSRLRSTVDSNKIERPKFCIPISRKEKEDDFMTFLGRVPRQRPAKRPKNVQKQINKVFPGLWLREVTAEMYEVHDTNQNGRFGKRKRRGKGF